MYVFRDGRRRVSGRELLHALIAELRQLPANAAGDHLIPALIRAGELESGTADSLEASAECLTKTASATDAIARAFVRRHPLANREQLIATLAALEVPATLWNSPLEGFAYYGLHPRSYADLADALPAPGQVAVIGIRSIGCTLSAVVLAALRAREVFAERISVRPAGHPFDRKTQLSPEQRQWLTKFQSSSQYFICDEGPGLSGSSFLSTAEALVEAGADIDAAGIHFLCSRSVEPELLRARDGARRWGRFGARVISFLHHLEEPGQWIGGGDWRSHPLIVNGHGRGAHQPAVWTHMERAKFLSRDGRRLYKFEGFGHYGEAAQHNGELLAEHKFAPRPLRRSHNGFACYEFVKGRHASATELSESWLRRFAEYCDLRQKNFPAPHVDGNVDPEMTVPGMCAANLREAFSCEADFFSLLPLERPVLSDSRMMPHEWLITDSGSLVKVDGASHGDDHFFPGPCDIAWDLAGLTVEWGLPPHATDFMCNEYRRLSGDSPAARLPGYILAYSLFRTGYCQMAAEALAGTPEAPGLEAAHASYRELATRQIDGLKQFARHSIPIDRGSRARQEKATGGSPLL